MDSKEHAYFYLDTVALLRETLEDTMCLPSAARRSPRGRLRQRMSAKLSSNRLRCLLAMSVLRSRRLFGLLGPLTLAQSHTWAATVLFDEFNTRTF